MFGIGSSLPGVTLSLKYLFYNQIWFSELSSNEFKVINLCCDWVGGYTKWYSDLILNIKKFKAAIKPDFCYRITHWIQVSPKEILNGFERSGFKLCY